MRQNHFQRCLAYIMSLALFFTSIACSHEKDSNAKQTSVVDVSKAENGITEITIERSTCRGNCPAYRASFYKNGEAMYWGIANMSRLGRYHASDKDCPTCYFDKMAKLLTLHGFLNLKDKYEEGTTDSNSLSISIVLNGERKTVRNFDPTRGPIELWGLAMAIDGMVSNIVWEKD